MALGVDPTLEPLPSPCQAPVRPTIVANCLRSSSGVGVPKLPAPARALVEMWPPRRSRGSQATALSGQGPVRRHLRRTLHQGHGGLMFNSPPAHGNPDSPANGFVATFADPYAFESGRCRTNLDKGPPGTRMTSFTALGAKGREPEQDAQEPARLRSNFLPLGSC